MKKPLLILFFAGCAMMNAQAQEQPKDSWPAWTISKDVARIQFRNVLYTPAAIKTGNINWVISKGVQRQKSDEAQTTGNVVSSGYPTWTISKGVARWQAEKNSTK